MAESDVPYSNAPPITRALVREWPARWCRVKIGDPRKEVTRIMGAYPTTQDSHMIPLIPPIHVGANGEVESNQPPSQACSDTWVVPGTYQFNAFYDPSLHVQQLDFSGPPSKLPCRAPLRVW